jgi:hypothetical protein
MSSAWADPTPAQAVDPLDMRLRRIGMALAAAMVAGSVAVEAAGASSTASLPKVTSAVTSAAGGRLARIALTFEKRPSAVQRRDIKVAVPGYALLQQSFVPQKRQLLLSVQRQRPSTASRPLIRLDYGGRRTSVRSKETASVTFNCMDASSADRAAVFAALGAAGAAWARINLDWPGLEPSRGVYSPATLSSLQDCLDQARQNGLQVLLIVGHTPAWARSSNAQFAPPDNPQDYADALAYLAGRFPGQVGAWEIWNEENTSTFWQGSAAEYVQLLRASYLTLEKADPNALVVFGGTYGNDAEWVSAAYKAGAAGYYDVMATHPYPDAPDDIKAADALQSAAAVHRVMLAHGDDKPIWFTESGWSSPNSISQAQQASALTQELDYTRTSLPYVTNVFWFEAKNEVQSVTADSWQGGLSLIAPNGTPRPAYDALKSWVQAG